MNLFLVDDQAVDQFGVRDRTAGLLLHLDVVDVDGQLSVALLGNGLGSLDGQLGKGLAVPAHRLSSHGGHGDLEQSLVALDLDSGPVEDLHGLGRGEPVPVRDDGRVDVGLDELLSLLEQFTGQHHGSGGAVAALGILGLGDLNDHLGSGVLNIDLLQNGHAVVGDDDISQAVDQHLVHALRSQRRAYGVGDGTGSSDVVRLGLAVLGPLSALFEHNDRLALS